MIQRIAVRLLLKRRGRPLLLRRSTGRESILGKYELPGGRVREGEQPEDALQRYLREDIGVREKLRLGLHDVLTYTDDDDRGIQYAVIVYRCSCPGGVDIRLQQHYDKYTWYHGGRPDQERLTGLTRAILGVVADGSRATVADSEAESRLPVVYTDGGSRGNPGKSATGFVLFDESGDVVEQGGSFLGVTTNNQAEYQAVREGLEAALQRGWRAVEFRIDSLLVVNQLNGVYKVKNRDLWPVHEHIKELVSRFERVRFVHVSRELNQLADGMVNRILDEHENSSV